MNHALVIRMKYEDEEKFNWRISFFRAMSLPRLKKQTDQNFDIWILCNEKHDQQILDLWPEKVYTIHANTKIQGDPGYNRNSGESNSVEPFKFWLPEYKIQTRIDSDDLVHCDFIKKINSEFSRETSLAMLAFKPMRFRLDNLRLYKIHPKDGAYRKSQFISIFNPKYDTFIYEVGHRVWAYKIKQMEGKLKIIDFGYCFGTYHWDNASTIPQPTDELL